MKPLDRSEFERLLDILICAVQAVEDVSPEHTGAKNLITDASPEYLKRSDEAHIARQNLVAHALKGTK